MEQDKNLLSQVWDTVPKECRILILQEQIRS